MDERRWYPLFLDLEGKRVVVVGGGAVAERKIEALVAAGASVLVVAPEVTEGIVRLAASAPVAIERRAFEQGDLEGAALAFAATDRPEVNRLVASEASARGVPANVADHPELGSFIVPATIERGAIRIAFSTGGHSPLLARHLRERLEREIGPGISALAEVLGELREAARAALPDEAGRREFFAAVLASPAAAMLERGEAAAARKGLEALCRKWGVPFGGRD
ncbi:MAG TPA: bifunctional precorrin-2 dehydrogenase/sirohydrochlorin ferrochelatase [Thermoanaerobaculia bacterium]|nr:bifunctional precorrin-2 dehydrogenase/sirohydrochlorin ferrochelatase [Thermoanaerobaculia bacterium]